MKLIGKVLWWVFVGAVLVVFVVPQVVMTGIVLALFLFPSIEVSGEKLSAPGGLPIDSLSWLSGISPTQYTGEIIAILLIVGAAVVLINIKRA